ncbi:TadE/TadG family type IV pilus assembly protein [Streptomyces xinghaiensis]|uniref:TadE/TadG family type IV pilus assembly protein n=1 Tax=Streptomyces xinghaiensis TaxID=1038928 RepID=UPI000584EADA|nr:TadE family protein [Streptomyces xinghaiensis]MZE80903.1 pilus assembly protein [Streptomyces sp. SID5475]
MRHIRSRLREDRGSEAIQAAIVTPLLIMFLCSAVAAGRIVMAGTKADAAAEDAAREASLSRSAGAAQSAARAAAEESLAGQGVDCADIGIRVDTSGLTVPVGTVGTVTVTVRCTVGLSDLLLPGVPGSRTLESSFTSVVDQYRQREN